MHHFVTLFGIIEIKNNKYHGKIICYYPNGDLYFIANFNNGILKGIYEEYYDNICVYKYNYIEAN